MDPLKIYNRVHGDGVGNSGIFESIVQYLFNDDDAVERRLKMLPKATYEDAVKHQEQIDKIPVLQRRKSDEYKKHIAYVNAPYMRQHEDAKDIYLGFPQRFNTMAPAQYSPTQGKIKNAYYVKDMRTPAYFEDVLLPTLNNLKLKKIRTVEGSKSIGPELLRPGILNRNSNITKITKAGNAVATIPFLGNATFSNGIDKNKGEYISIYDDWDYNTDVSGTPGDNIAKWIGGTPFQIYDRYYLDDYYGVDSSANHGTYYGGYLPEVIVKPRQK